LHLLASGGNYSITPAAGESIVWLGRLPARCILDWETNRGQDRLVRCSRQHHSRPPHQSGWPAVYPRILLVVKTRALRSDDRCLAPRQKRVSSPLASRGVLRRLPARSFGPSGRELPGWGHVAVQRLAGDPELGTELADLGAGLAH